MTIPRVCLCAQARSGSSMMMHVLQEGGLIVDKELEIENRNNLFRNPNGLFENRINIVKGIFNNSFKLLDPSLFHTVPLDYKFIFINRPLTAILASWEELVNRGISEGRDLIEFRNTVLEKANINKSAWVNILTANPNILIFDYDTVCSNPSEMAITLSTYINTTEFKFDELKAANVIDKTLYSGRK
jgi:hypothetical protein